MAVRNETRKSFLGFKYYKIKGRIKMKKMIVLALLVVFMMPLAVSHVLAADETARTGSVDAGNKLCPVSGDPVSGSDFVIYQGKRYGLCCSMCKAPFLAAPEKYIAAMEAKEKASVPAAPVTQDAAASREMERDMEQGSL
jgi:YHS domain-containing protein